MIKLKTILSILIVMCSINSFAEVDRVSVESNLAKRNILLETINKDKVINIGWLLSDSSDSEFRKSSGLLLPLSNYITEYTRILTVINPMVDDRESIDYANDYEYDLLYTNSLSAAELVRYNWSPLVTRTNEIKPVVIKLKEDNSITVDNWFLKTILVNKDSTELYYIKYSLWKDGKSLKLIGLKEVSDKLEEKVNKLLKKEVKTIVINEIEANKILKDKRFEKVYSSNVSAVGNVILANPKLSTDMRAFYTNVFKNMKYENNSMSVLNKETLELKNSGEIFKEAPTNIFGVTKDMMLKLNLSRYKKDIK